MTIHNWLLGTMGAAIGASVFIYGGHFVRDKWGAQAQTVSQPAAQQPLSVGDESVVIGNVKGAIGNKSVVVGPTDERGNTIIRPPPGGLAVGAGARAGPNSISIGAGAGARTRTSEVTMYEPLAIALEELATAIAAAPSVVIGSQVTVNAGPGSSGTVIGKQVIVTAGPGATGTIIGEQITASSSAAPVNAKKAEALREGAASVRSGLASRASISALVIESNLPGNNPSVNAANARALQALQASDLP